MSGGFNDKQEHHARAPLCRAKWQCSAAWASVPSKPPAADGQKSPLQRESERERERGGVNYPPAMARAVWSGCCWLRARCCCAALLVRACAKSYIHWLIAVREVLLLFDPRTLLLLISYQVRSSRKRFSNHSYSSRARKVQSVAPDQRVCRYHRL
jgi:hypothetical protein